MLRFILKGILRDRSRSLFPILVVAAGVLIIVFTLAFMQGYEDSMIRQNARFETGHVKIVTAAYAELIDRKPYDLGIWDSIELQKQWQEAYPELSFVQRIHFGALLDVPDADGNTKAQAEIVGFGVDLLGSNTEIENLNLQNALVKGKLPSRPGEILISDIGYMRLALALGDTITLIGSTAEGSLSMQNFIISGTMLFGFEALDRGGVVADLQDVRHFLDMEDACGEVLGFFKSGTYNAKKAEALKKDFAMRFGDPDDEYAAVMLNLTDQNNLGAVLAMMDQSLGIITSVFILVLGIVLWNSGLMNSIRRYGEIGVRLAMGEEKRHLYVYLITESLLIGLIGSLIGTALGLLISAYFNLYGMDVSAYNRESSILSESIVYTKIDALTALWGFIPGIFSTLLGSMLAGLVIFKRKTSELFKELEV